MPATSEKQRRAAGMALALKRGQLTGPAEAGESVHNMAKMATGSLRDFAKKKGHHASPLRYHKRTGGK